MSYPEGQRDTRSVVVVGAGVSGLVTALRLTQPALAGLAAVLAVRLAMPGSKSWVTAGSFLFAAATSVTAFLTGVASG